MSVLGLLFFLIITNDIVQSISKLKCVQFADDTTVYFSGENAGIVCEVVNRELIPLHNWAVTNKLVLNHRKTNFMVITHQKPRSIPIVKIGNEPITQVYCRKFPRLNIDSGQTCRDHLNYVCGGISRSVGKIHRISPFVLIGVLKSLYFAFVQSHMRFGLAVWGE